jgi:hypothetical protein
MKFFTPKKKEDEKESDEKIEDEKKTVKEVNNSTKEPKKFGFNLPKKNVKQQSSEEQQPIVEDTLQQVKTETPQVQADDKKIDISFSQNLNSDEKLKKLIESLMSANTDTINPSIDLEKNQIRYPFLAKIGESEENADYLEKLASSSASILEREISERLIVCPHHPEDFTVSLRLYCPVCSSMDIRKLHLIEHKVCGYIAEKEEYGIVSVSDLRTCPNCKRQIKELQKEIRLPGQWSKCSSCNKKFDNPVLKLHCRRFDHDFDLTEIESITVHRYKLKKDAGRSIDILTLLSPLKKLLTTHGFIVEELSNVKGKSGVSHHTDIFAHNEKNQTVAVFIKSANEIIEDTEVNSILVNILDIGPTVTIFIGIPSVSERAKAMASTHNVKIVTGKDVDKIIIDVEKIISEKIISADSPRKILS